MHCRFNTAKNVPRWRRVILFLVCVCFVAACKKADGGVAADNAPPNARIVDYFGPLQVKGNTIVGEKGTPVVLRGMSLFWSQWGGTYFTAGCVNWLRDDWKCTVVRAAMGVDGGGYLTNPEAELRKTTDVIDACISAGIYVIVDWHDHNAQNHLSAAKEFFRTIAQRYGDKPNVIYEVFNEPMQISWRDSVKPFAVEVINVIRQYDPDNLVVVGNPAWSQDVDVAANDPIVDVNVAYSLHFYSGTHRQWLRDKAATALNLGAALFVTEYGISQASGDGAIDYAETARWTAFIDSCKLSACNWSIIDKTET